MENISVNALVDSYETHLPREISLNVAKGVISKFDDKETILNEYKIAINALISSKQLRVINCTGTLLHTNLGRAQTQMEFNGHASNIEYDLQEQTRGERNSYLNYSMNLLLGSEGVCFVNNNASSLFITLHAIKKNENIALVEKFVCIPAPFQSPLTGLGSSVAEILTSRRPVIFIPLPTSFDNHQLENTKLITNIGGGWIYSFCSSVFFSRKLS